MDTLLNTSYLIIFPKQQFLVFQLGAMHVLPLQPLKFLHGEPPMPSPREIMNTIALFANTMRDGNIHYKSLAMPSHQPNLDAREALQTRQLWTNNFTGHWDCFSSLSHSLSSLFFTCSSSFN